MNRNLIVTLALSTAFAGGIASAAPLTTNSTDSTAKSDATATTTINADTPVNERYCLRHTGSHINTKSNSGKEYTDCVNANGRVYTRQDIERTGTNNVGDALRKLDPSIH